MRSRRGGACAGGGADAGRRGRPRNAEGSCAFGGVRPRIRGGGDWVHGKLPRGGLRQPVPRAQRAEKARVTPLPGGRDRDSVPLAHGLPAWVRQTRYSHRIPGAVCREFGDCTWFAPTGIRSGFVLSAAGGRTPWQQRTLMGPIEVFSEKLAKRSSVCYPNKSKPKATTEILVGEIKRNFPARSASVKWA